RLYALAAGDYRDITSGSSTGSPSYAAGVGYDLVTGRGSPLASLVVADLVGQSAPPPTPTPGATHFSVSAATSSTAGSAFAVTVRVLDAYGNLVSGDNSDRVTIALGSNSTGGTLNGTATVTVSGGVATFSTLSLNRAGAGYTLTAAAGSLGGATSASFTITA